MIGRQLVRGGGRIAALALVLAWAQLAAAQELDFGNFGDLGNLAGSRPKVSVTAEFTPANGDRPALLFVTADVAKGFHVYATTQGKNAKGEGPQATVITLDDNAPARLVGPFQPLEKPMSRIDDQAWKGLELLKHEDRVTWVAPIELNAGAVVSSLSLKGRLTGQACNPNTCIPQELPFEATAGTGRVLPAGFTLTIAPPPSPALAEDPNLRSPAGANANPSAETPGPAVTLPSATAGVAYDLSKVQLAPTRQGSLIYYLLMAFAGGIVLNVMPCVLPVIGLKIMSFVQQSGQSRRRALVLNVWYSAGIIAVFMILGGLAIAFQVGWGSQLANSGFTVTLIAIVFAMALSMLGLWEIPIPGFANSGAMIDAAHREGATAAFLKGVLTTILATPCTGPFMVSAITWALRQPSYVTLSVFAALGLGMASPYLVIGAFPSLIRFLPKPGMWMESFKKAMGLVLLATVVWLLSTLEPPLVVPTIALMVGIIAACWWFARVPLTDPLAARLRAWSEALAIISVLALFSFGYLYPKVTQPKFERKLNEFAQLKVEENQLEIAARLMAIGGDGDLQGIVGDLVANVSYDGDQPWQSFTLPKLARLALDERRTVLVDFTADWCASCKVFEETVLKSNVVTQAIEDAGVVTMTADFTRQPAWMAKTIRALGGIGVPLIAIFPADRPYQPIVFASGIYTQDDVLQGIAKATSNRSTAASRPPQAPEFGALVPATATR